MWGLFIGCQLGILKLIYNPDSRSLLWLQEADVAAIEKNIGAGQIEEVIRQVGGFQEHPLRKYKPHHLCVPDAYLIVIRPYRIFWEAEIFSELWTWETGLFKGKTTTTCIFLRYSRSHTNMESCIL